MKRTLQFFIRAFVFLVVSFNGAAMEIDAKTALENNYTAKEDHPLRLKIGMSLEEFLAQAGRPLNPDLETHNFQSFYEQVGQPLYLEDPITGKHINLPKTYRTFVDFQSGRLAAIRARLNHPKDAVKAGPEIQKQLEYFTNLLEPLGWKPEDKPGQVRFSQGERFLTLSVKLESRFGKQEQAEQLSNTYAYIELEAKL